LTRNWAFQTKITALDIQERENCASLKEKRNYVALYMSTTYKRCTTMAIKYYRLNPLQITHYKKAMLVCEVHTNAGQLNVNVGIKYNKMVTINLRQYV
jgi:hypothetical protein